MSTPIETNTEELQEILQTVYNLPGKSGDRAYDLVLGINVANTKTQNSDGWAWQLPDMTTEDVSVVSGDVSAVVEKIKQGLPVKVALAAIYFYNTRDYYREVCQAIQTTLNCWDGENQYPNAQGNGLCCLFMLNALPMNVSSTIRIKVLKIFINSLTGEVYSCKTYGMDAEE